MKDVAESLDLFKKTYVASLLHQKDKWHDKFLISRGKSYTRLELAEEIEGDTAEGMEMLIMMMDLSAHMVSKDKSLNS